MLHKWQSQIGIVSLVIRTTALISYCNRNKFQTFFGTNPKIQQLLSNAFDTTNVIRDNLMPIFKAIAT